MNHWLTPLAYLLGGMTLKWVLDLFFLRHVYRDNEHKLNVREAEFTTLKHEHTQALTDLKNKLTELDATSKAKLLVEGSLAKVNSNLVALRTHVLRLEEDLGAARSREAELVERVTVRDGELQAATARLGSLEGELREQTTGGESLRLELAEVKATAATLADAEAGLRVQLAETQQESSRRLVRLGELEDGLVSQRQLQITLEAAVQSRDAQIADCQSRFAALEAERESVATTLKLTDRELAIARAEVLAQARRLEEAALGTSGRQAELEAMNSRVTELTSARTVGETQIKELETVVNRLKQQVMEFRESLDTAAAANRRLAAELSEARERLAGSQISKDGFAATLKASEDEVVGLRSKLAEQQIRIQSMEDECAGLQGQLKSALSEFQIPAVTAPADKLPFPDPDPAWVHRVSDIQAELAAVSESHAQLETELIRERQRSADLEEQLRVAASTSDARVETSGSAPAVDLLAEIDELNRERNTLAAELAALKSQTPSQPSGSGRKKKARTADVELFPVASASTDSAAETDASSEGEGVVEFSSKCPQHLSDVKGIGPVFEQRLYVAGVGSYWELAQLTDRTLAEVLELDAPQRESFDFAAARADAARLARETRSEGRKWTGDQPDDLEPLEGIGAAIEKRLYNAGICTFAALAAASEESLAEICPTAKFRGANYARWIEQARQRIAREED